MRAIAAIMSALALLVTPIAMAIKVKESAPDVYVVQKGDTLWDISSLYLEQPWNWPELWRNNSFLTNPHLIYPGDELRLRIGDDGEAKLELVREPEVTKPLVKLSPEGRKVFKPEPIPTIPWSVISTFAANHLLLSDEEYQRLPIVLGDPDGGMIFSTGELIVGEKIVRTELDYVIIRKQAELLGMDGELLGWQVREVADAEVLPQDTGRSSLLRVKKSSFEAIRGDRVMPAIAHVQDKALGLVPASEQQGFVLGSLEQHSLMGKYDVVALDIGSSEVVPGTVFGIYRQGPDINVSEQPVYSNEGTAMDSLIAKMGADSQPALKVGELVVFKVFENCSYALIIKSTKSIKRGAIVARP